MLKMRHLSNAFQFITVRLQQGPLQCKLQSTYPDVGAVNVHPRAMWWSKKLPCEPAISVPYEQKLTYACKQGCLASLQLVRSMDGA